MCECWIKNDSINVGMSEIMKIYFIGVSEAKSLVTQLQKKKKQQTVLSWMKVDECFQV